MGTRGNVLFYDRTDKIGGLYCQWDAYPTGLGKELKAALHDGQAAVVNGYSPGLHQVPGHFNGMGCLAAYAIGKLKGEEIGNFYLDPYDPVTHQGEDGGFHDWTYRFILRGDDPNTGRAGVNGTAILCLEVYHWADKVWDGPFSEFNPEALEAEVYGRND